MIALIDEFRKELKDIAEFAPSTVDNYVACMAAFFDYARNRLRIDPVFAKGKHILDWIGQVKKTGVSKSRLEHHRSALMSMCPTTCKSRPWSRSVCKEVFFGRSQ
jgi:hypothetical protein